MAYLFILTLVLSIRLHGCDILTRWWIKDSGLKDSPFWSVTIGGLSDLRACRNRRRPISGVAAAWMSKKARPVVEHPEGTYVIAIRYRAQSGHEFGWRRSSKTPENSK